MADKEEVKVEEKQRWKVWLPENHPGSRKVVMGTGQVFNLNRLNDPDQEEAKQKQDYPIKEMMLTETEVNDLRNHYGFKASLIKEKKAVIKDKDEEKKG